VEGGGGGGAARPPPPQVLLFLDARGVSIVLVILPKRCWIYISRRLFFWSYSFSIKTSKLRIMESLDLETGLLGLSSYHFGRRSHGLLSGAKYRVVHSRNPSPFPIKKGRVSGSRGTVSVPVLPDGPAAEVEPPTVVLELVSGPAGAPAHLPCF
jgi:hypothetical protein